MRTKAFVSTREQLKRAESETVDMLDRWHNQPFGNCMLEHEIPPRTKVPTGGHVLILGARKPGTDFLAVVVPYTGPNAVPGFDRPTVVDLDGRVRVPAAIVALGNGAAREFAFSVRKDLARQEPDKFGALPGVGFTFDLEDAGAGEYWA